MFPAQRFEYLKTEVTFHKEAAQCEWSYTAGAHLSGNRRTQEWHVDTGAENWVFGEEYAQSTLWLWSMVLMPFIYGNETNDSFKVYIEL